MIKELKGEECLALRSLWEEVFNEDSKEFTDYYFKEKVKNNHAFIIQIDPVRTEDIVAMLHLAPYDMQIRSGQEMITSQINYIIGVATKKPCRHNGFMGRLLNAALIDMFHRKQPFTFLMPASPKIYEPYQFVYIYDRIDYRIENFKQKAELRAASLTTDKWEITSLREDEIPQLKEFACSYLKENYDIYIRRDHAYYQTMMKELKVQNGAVYLIRNKGVKENITGYFFYTEEEGKPNIQEAVYDKSFHSIKREGKKPIIMARIVHLQSMLALLRLKSEVNPEEKSIVITVKVTDPLITENNAVWQCDIGSTKAVVNKVCDKNAENTVCSITINEMTSWIFGYRSAQDCFHFSNEEIRKQMLNKLSKIKVFSKVFINEIV